MLAVEGRIQPGAVKHMLHANDFEAVRTTFNHLWQEMKHGVEYCLETCILNLADQHDLKGLS